jgi:uncharacterized protein (TIGR03437 family)
MMPRPFSLFFLALIFGSAAFAQSIPFTITNFTAPLTGTNNTYTTTLVAAGPGTATVSGPGLPVSIATVNANGVSARERGLGCGGALQLTITFTFDPNDTLTVLASGPLVKGSSTATLNVFVTGGTGVFNGIGGSGTFTGSLASSGFTGTITGSGSGTLVAGAPVPPVISPSGIVPVFSSVPIIQPGSWISIYGSNFATTTTIWNGDFPTKLGGVSVLIDNKPAYLWFVSSTQINVQAPDNIIQGCVNISVTTPNGTASSQVTLQPAQPSFSLYSGTQYAIGEIATPNGSGAYANGAYDLVGPAGKLGFNTRPVKVGETVQLFGVGFGPVQTPVPAGQVDSVATVNNITSGLTVTVGGINAKVAFAGEILAGLYQINIVVPKVPSGDQLIVANIGGGLPLLFSAFTTQNCQDPDPQGSNPTNCNVYLTVQ